MGYLLYISSIQLQPGIYKKGKVDYAQLISKAGISIRRPEWMPFWDMDSAASTCSNMRKATHACELSLMGALADEVLDAIKNAIK